MDVTNKRSKSLTLTWDAVAEATGHQVKLNAGGEAKTVTGNAESYPFIDLDPATGYTLYVRSTRGEEWSDWESRRAETTKLAQPKLSVDDRDSHSIRVSWKYVSGATGYQVRRTAASSPVNPTGDKENNYIGLQPANQYTLEVRAIHDDIPAAASDWAAVSSWTRLEQPTQVTVDDKSTTSNSLRITWAPVTGATGYQVIRSAMQSPTPASGDRAHTFTRLDGNNTYELEVRALKSGNPDATSKWSSTSGTTLPDTTTPTATAPTAPTGLSVDDVADTSATLSWTKSPGATDYVLQLDGDDVALDTPLGDADSYEFTGLTARTAHVLGVSAKNAAGASDYEELTLLVPPTLNEPTLTHNSISLTWTLHDAETATGADVKLDADGDEVEADSSTSHTFDQGIDPDTPYTVYVRATNSQGASAWTSVTRTTPSAPTTPQTPQVTGEIRARKLADGRVEFEFRTKGGISIQPTKRFVRPSEMTHGVWKKSSSFSVTINEVSYEVGQIWARLDNDQCPHSIEVVVSRPDGELEEPTKNHYAHRRKAVNLWVRSSEVTIELSASGSGAAGAASEGDASMTAAPEGHVAPADQDGGSMAAAQSDAGGAVAGQSETLPALCEPLNVRVSAKTSGSLTLSWEAVPEATGHQVKLNAGGAAQTVSGTGTSRKFSGLNSSTSHTLYVRSTRGTERSDWASKTETTSASIVTPTTKVCPNGSVIPVDDDCPVPPTTKECPDGSEVPVDDDCPIPPPTCDPDTKPGATQTVTSTETETDVDGKAQRQRSRTITQKQSRTVGCGSDGAWDTGGWTNDGAANRGAWGPYGAWSCSMAAGPRPTAGERTVTISTRTAWSVSGGVASKIRTVTKRDDTNPHQWSGPKGCAWVDDWQRGSPYTEKTTIETSVRPSHDVVTVVLQRTSQTRWVAVDDGLFCIEYQERRNGVRQSFYLRPHVWSHSAEAWVDGARNSAPFFTHPTGVFSWSGWSRTGTSRLCPQGAQGVGGQAGYSPAQLSGGEWRWQWGDDLWSFSVPAGATVELRSRTLDSGEEAAVFRVGEVELVVTSTALSGVSGLVAPEDPTLAAIATSLQIAQPEQPSVPAESERECVVVEQPESGSAQVDLNADSCLVVPNGGSVNVALGGYTRTLALPTGRGWLLVATSDAETAPAISIVDLTSGGYLIVNAADGTEVNRGVPEDYPDLGALFDSLGTPPAEPDSRLHG
ncbi:MAG: fibronectin type III domain-containing protein [Chloroflexota bacterium]|nr:fibronectin type III domain-containing protein [Chloroflexota bacterium]